MLSHPLTDQWNEIFLGEWNQMKQGGMLEGSV